MLKHSSGILLHIDCKHFQTINFFFTVFDVKIAERR